MHNVKIKGEVASDNTEAAKEYPAKQLNIIEEGGYTLDQVFILEEDA